MMTERHCLVCPYGFVGDILFTSSVARKLKEEGQFDVVDMAIGFPQVEPLLKLNPWIDSVILANPLSLPREAWDTVVQTNETTKLIPPPLQFQRECGIRNPDTRYEVFTDPKVDAEVAEQYPRPFVAVMEPTTWQAKAFRFTPEEYQRGIDVPYKGYGGRLRDIPAIVAGLGKDYELVEVGLPLDSISAARRMTTVRSLVWDASVLKRAAFFIGTEGGFANLAAGVGTKTILTSEFVWQLYGANGVLKKIPEPQLGPRYYFPEVGHVDLNPYYSDEEVLDQFQQLLSGKTTAADYAYDWISHDANV